MVAAPPRPTVGRLPGSAADAEADSILAMPPDHQAGMAGEPLGRRGCQGQGSEAGEAHARPFGQPARQLLGCSMMCCAAHHTQKAFAASLLPLYPHQFPSLSVRLAAEGDRLLGTNQECSICLERLVVSGSNWAILPCHHSCCASCLVDVVRSAWWCQGCGGALLLCCSSRSWVRQPIKLPSPVFTMLQAQQPAGGGAQPNGALPPVPQAGHRAALHAACRCASQPGSGACSQPPRSAGGSDGAQRAWRLGDPLVTCRQQECKTLLIGCAELASVHV